MSDKIYKFKSSWGYDKPEYSRNQFEIMKPALERKGFRIEIDRVSSWAFHTSFFYKFIKKNNNDTDKIAMRQISLLEDCTQRIEQLEKALEKIARQETHKESITIPYLYTGYGYEAKDVYKYSMGEVIRIARQALEKKES